VHVLGFAVELGQHAADFGARVPDDFFHAGQVLESQDPVPVPRIENQMENMVSVSTDVVISGRETK
jgi:hypothetical protein